MSEFTSGTCMAGSGNACFYLEVQRRPKRDGISQWRLCQKHADRLVLATKDEDVLVLEEIHDGADRRACPERPGTDPESF